jgi:hypothetical protein
MPPAREDLTEVWALVDELEDLSVRLREAADHAMEALRLQEEAQDADE